MDRIEGPMAQAVRARDWSKSPLGPIESWPTSLRLAVGLCLGSRFPMFVWWGPELVNIYNDAYAPVLGQKHPGALGRDARSVWDEIWPVVGPQAEAVLLRGLATWNHRVQLAVERHGYIEETWFTWSYSPIFDDRGNVGGVFCACTEETAHVLAERERDFLLARVEGARRRDRLLVSLDDAVRPLSDPSSIASTCARMLREHLDVESCAYADVCEDEDSFDLSSDARAGAPVIVGRYRVRELGEEVMALFRAKQPFVVVDAATHGAPIGDVSFYEAMQIRAAVCLPLHDGERLVGALAVCEPTARAWTLDEVELVRHVATRCWHAIGRVRAERALRESEARFRAMSDSAPVMIWVADRQGRSEYLNAQWYAFTGQTPQDAVGVGWLSAVHPDDADRVLHAFLDDDQLPRAFVLEYRVRHASGEYRWCVDAGTPRWGPSGEPLGFIGSVVDITDRKRSEDTLGAALEAEQHARGEAERASRMKDEFLATLSHELRTPLNAILGWSQILKAREDLLGPVAQAVGVIERNARAQARIIDDLLDMSAIISGKIRLDVQPVDIAGILRAAVETARPTADAKEVLVRCVFEPLGSALVAGDASRLQQVLWNLISNAIKFTPRGGKIAVSLARAAAHVEVRVTDSGEGIALGFLPFVFDRFRQADASSTRRHGGLGLGLSIVKQLVELHGGTVAARSDGLGCGSVFAVRLPLAGVHSRCDRRQARRADTPPWAFDLPHAGARVDGVEVLVVDDDADALDLVKRLLEERGANVRSAVSAEEALKLVQQHRFDVIVSDIGMPGGDGLTLLRRVRSLAPESGGRVPAIALTAYVRAEDRVNALRAGFQMHVAKPVQPAELVAMVASLGMKAPSRP